MIFADEKTKQFNQSIKNKDLKSALIASSNMETNKGQDLRLFELIESNDIFQVLNDLTQEGIEVKDKYLALSSIYLNAKYFWDIGVGTTREAQRKDYPYLTILYEKKIEEKSYQRTLFVEWTKLFTDMVNDQTQYRDDINTSSFYSWPHDYEENVIERTAFTFLNIMFKEAKKEELLKIISDCQKYPKIPHAKTEIDKQYNQQNSRYYDVQHLSSWLSENALPLINREGIKKFSPTIPLVSQGIIQEIHLMYNELINDKSLLEPQDLLITEKLYEQRLPELLNQYENFDHKNYSDLTNSKNQNASELLLKSLTEVYQVFENLNEKINLKKIENLSFNVKLTKEYIKHNF